MLKFLKVVKLLYSLFIGVQLVYLGYAEGTRVKSMILFMINNSKKLRIIDHQFDKVDEE